MAIIDMQRGIVEAGRIRLGQQVPTSGGKTRPEKLSTFRLTSADRRRIDQAAELFGGTVAEWDAPAGKQWEVVTTTDALDVIVPPSDLSFSQHYELWSAGGCQRRCDGVTESIGERPCVCDPNDRECDIHTRLSVLIRDLPGLGVWRVDTQGWYAARELAGAVQLIQLAAGQGALLPARLRLEQRAVKRPGNNGKPVTQRFAVPVLDIEVTPAQLLSGSAPQPLALVDAGRPPLTPVPASLGRPQLSIAEQSAPPPPAPARKNAAPPLPASGRRRAGAAMTEAVAPGADSTEDDDLPPMPTPRPTAATEPEPELETASPAAPRQDDTPRGRLMRRLHSKDTYGLEHDQVRDVAASLLQVTDPDWSLGDCSDEELQRVDRFLDSLTIEMATQRVCELAQKRGMVPDEDPWPTLDAITVAATGVQPEQLTAAQWVAFGIRLNAGDYDPPAAQQQPDAGDVCPTHGQKWQPSATGKTWRCPVEGCGRRAAATFVQQKLLAAG
jgi:hypothetical protein